MSGPGTPGCPPPQPQHPVGISQAAKPMGWSGALGRYPRRVPLERHRPSVPLSQDEELKSSGTRVGTITVVGWHQGGPRADSEGLSRGSPAGCGTPASPAPAAKTSLLCWAPACAWRSWICPSTRGCVMPACSCCARGSSAAPASCRRCGKGPRGQPALPPSHPEQLTNRPVKRHVPVCLGPAGWGAAG